MQDILIKILVICYGATAIVDLMAYLPTINDLWFHKKPSANVKSYILWTTTAGIAFSYSLFVLNDWPFRFVSGTMFTSNLLILILRIRLNKKKV